MNLDNDNDASRLELETGPTVRRYSLPALLDFLLDLIAISFYGLSWICALLPLSHVIAGLALGLLIVPIVVISAIYIPLGIILRWLAKGIARRRRIRILMTALFLGLLGAAGSSVIFDSLNRPLLEILGAVVVVLVCFAFSTILGLSVLLRHPREP